MDIKTQSSLQLMKDIGQLLSLVRLYYPDHPVTKTKSQEVLSKLEEITLKKETLTFTVQGNLIFLNGEKLELQDRLSKIFMADFSKLKIGSLNLEPGLTLEELGVFISLLNNTEKLSGESQVKEFLDQNKVQHIIPHYATYELVQEDEKVVKTEEVVNINQLPLEVIKSFSSGLKNSIVKDKTLVHNYDFLSAVFTELAQEINTPEELSKIIWVIGDYLIGEVSTLKQEVINHKILEQLKSFMFSLYEKKENHEQWKGHVENSFAKVIVALQLKRLVLVYKKHKIGIAAVLSKIKIELQDLPEESKLYQQIKQELKHLGLPDLDAGMFI